MKSGVKKIPQSPIAPGELALIAAIRERAERSLGSRRILTRGIGDDCAILRPRRDEELVVTTDLSLENVHFRRDWHPPQSVGHRCLARGLSDLAAMGARPEAAFLSLAIPTSLLTSQTGSPTVAPTSAWIDDFLDGIFSLAARYQVPLAGGDTAKSPAGAGGGLVTADIVLVGSVPKGKALLRSGARAGDIIYVTGALGGSAAELQSLGRHPSTFTGVDKAGHPQLFPEPRIEAGRKLLRRSLASAAIDLSDGLSTDLAHLCEASGLAAEIWMESLPVDARATLEQALHGGEDYELLFTAPKKVAIPNHLGGVSVHPIGRMKKPGKRPQVELRTNGKSAPLPPGGWEHFH